MQRHLKQILEDMDILRPFALQNQETNVELRSVMRRIIQHVEHLQRTPTVTPAHHQSIVMLLAQLLDAEHGILLKGHHDTGLPEQDNLQLQAHVTERQGILQAIQQDWAALQTFLNNCQDLLGKTPSNDADLGQHVRELEKHLREHLHQDGQLRTELNQFINALQGSIGSVLHVLDEVGEDAPELKQTQSILQQDLPDDPIQAKALLQQAREGLLQAGNKLTAASQTMRDNMKQQVSQMTDLSSRLEEAEYAARKDPLTGLANRRKLAEFLTSLPQDIAISFVMIDIDFFKKINDRYGHDAGDDILSALAKVLSDSTRGSDMVARLGGEEFCIILPEAKLQQAGTLAANLCQAIALHRFTSGSHHIDVTVSLGVSQKKDDETSELSIKRADKALYQSKKDGRNRVTLAK
ncbi:MAG: GGDEF domain-containing protein [Mariprofundaceae bacterium]|nr:GGDEF domain-containing protein [Mariprofundaceae bacterium]